MHYLYINPDTKETFYPVHIHNFNRSRPDEVRIMGSCRLNPFDKNYPDKLWVNQKDLYTITGVKFSEETIKSNTF